MYEKWEDNIIWDPEVCVMSPFYYYFYFFIEIGVLIKMFGAQCFHRKRGWLHFSSFEDMQVGTVHGNTHFSGSMVLYSVRKKTHNCCQKEK